MRIVFMGTPDFAVPSLQSIHQEGHEIVAVATAPDKPQGRGQKVRSSAVKQAAERIGISTILQPSSVKDPEFANAVASLEADVIVVVAFRILPESVYTAARLGAFNLHGSLLPRYRGAAPIHHAVLNGDLTTGVTTFFLKNRVDTGNVILTRSMPIGEDDTTGDVYERMMLLGADAVVETLRLIEDGDVAVQSQNDELATPAPKVKTADARVDWSDDARSVHNHIRGYSPIPGAWTLFRSSRVKLFRSRLVAGRRDGEESRTNELPPNESNPMVVNVTEPGVTQPGEIEVQDDRLLLACGDGAVEVIELQVEGKKRMSAAEFIHGYRVISGEMFGDRSD